MGQNKLTEEQINDIIEDIYTTSSLESSKTKILNFVRLMCDKQKEICAEYAEQEGDEGDELWIDKKSILNAPYPEEIT